MTALRGAWKLLTVRGIAVRLHWSFLALLAVVGLWGTMGQGPGQGLLFMLFVVLLFSLVVLHELAHSLVAQKYGVEVREIILLPIGGMAVMERMPEEPAREAAIAAAGPALNAVLAAVIYLIMWAVPGITFYHTDLAANSTPLTWGTVALFQANLGLLLFNILPAFPMDGGRLLRAALVKSGRSYARATSIAVTVSRVILALMLVYGIYRTNIFLILIPIFLLGSASAEESAVRSRATLGGLAARHLLPQDLVTLDEKTRLGDLVTLLLSSPQRDFPVLRGTRLVGTVSLDGLRAGLSRPGGADAPVAGVMRPPVLVSPGEPLAEIRRKLDAAGGASACIVERGKLLGMASSAMLDRVSALLEPGGERTA